MARDERLCRGREAAAVHGEQGDLRKETQETVNGFHPDDRPHFFARRFAREAVECRGREEAVAAKEKRQDDDDKGAVDGEGECR